ncbi:MAG: TspO/MBR family protein [Pseudomonadota bacterium]
MTDSAKSAAASRLPAWLADWRPIAVAAAGALLVSFAGGTLTDIGPWYRNLAKSPLNPPDFVFPLAWTAIFAAAGTAAVIGWRAAKTPVDQIGLIVLFFINANLNIAWSGLFFASKRPDLAFIEIAPLWLSLAALIWFLSRLSRVAALLIVPYLLWVSFAAYLNWRVVVLNPPFG